jgi:hypothetical protein
LCADRFGFSSRLRGGRGPLRIVRLPYGIGFDVSPCGAFFGFVSVDFRLFSHLFGQGRIDFRVGGVVIGRSGPRGGGLHLDPLGELGVDGWIRIRGWPGRSTARVAFFAPFDHKSKVTFGTLDAGSLPLETLFGYGESRLTQWARNNHAKWFTPVERSMSSTHLVRCDLSLARVV